MNSCGRIVRMQAFSSFVGLFDHKLLPGVAPMFVGGTDAISKCVRLWVLYVFLVAFCTGVI
jgi:hypothetical protein